MTVASFKDAVRMALMEETHEAKWKQVRYCDVKGR